MGTTYKKLSEIEHVLERPGMYIGSTTTERATKFVYDSSIKKFRKKEVDWNEGFMKIYDEIVTNSFDESKRNGKLKVIEVTVNKSENTISVYDDGGIRIDKFDKTDKRYIPDVIFSSLRAGSNFNDDEVRLGAGTNGIGSVCTNIFSKSFTVETADSSKMFKVTYLNNLSGKTEPVVKQSKKHFTRITYVPDLERFGMSEISDDFIDLMKSRLINIASQNSNLTVKFNDDSFHFSKFQEYASLYLQELPNHLKNIEDTSDDIEENNSNDSETENVVENQVEEIKEPEQNVSENKEEQTNTVEDGFDIDSIGSDEPIPLF